MMVKGASDIGPDSIVDIAANIEGKGRTTITVAASKESIRRFDHCVTVNKQCFWGVEVSDFEVFGCELNAKEVLVSVNSVYTKYSS